MQAHCQLKTMETGIEHRTLTGTGNRSERIEEAQLLGWPTILPHRKTNPNPNIAGPATVTQRLSARHDGRTGHNLAKIGTSPLNWPIIRQNEAYRANLEVFCTCVSNYM